MYTVVTGLILAINLPATAILWMPVLGGLFAIVAVKMLFGGLGQNFMNPALAARCFLLISFSGRMTDFTMDGVSSATPLAAMKAGELPDLLSLFLGFHGGCIGEVSALAIFAGGIYLIVKKVISVRIPLTYILSTAAFILLINLINGGDISTNYLLAQVLSGGILVGAFFMATDYATSLLLAISLFRLLKRLQFQSLSAVKRRKEEAKHEKENGNGCQYISISSCYFYSDSGIIGCLSGYQGSD